MEDRTVPEEKHKLVPDELTFAKLLEAAYVLQEHNREVKRLELCRGFKRDEAQPRNPSDPVQNSSAQQVCKPSSQEIPSFTTQEKSTQQASASDLTSTLERIAETQRQIHVRRMEFECALQLVVERVCELTNAAAAAIGMVEGNSVRYRAVTGSSAPSLESVLPLDKAMFAACLNGEVFRSTDTTKEGPLNTNECKRRGIGSLIAVPVYHDGGIAGGLELYYASLNAFTEPDVHTCQLMAGLVAEALVREEEANWRKSLATERAAMLAALEKLQPNLAALTEKSTAKTPLAPRPEARGSSSCVKCGHQLEPEEQFCGQCGSPRAVDYEAPNLQSKVASMWHMQESQKKETASESSSSDIESPAETVPSAKPQESLVRSLEQQIPNLFTSEDLELAANEEETAQVPTPMESREMSPDGDLDIASDVPEEDSREVLDASEERPTKFEAIAVADWGSAASARRFLEQFGSGQRIAIVLKVWNRHRGDIYLGIAVILVLCVIRWGIWSSPGAKATGAPATANATHRRPAREAGLSLFDRMLIELGLAEAPDPPQDHGDPSVQVWVDQRTALYYCPGTDLYGKTPKGRFITQREAQLDQFEPASRKACD